MSTVSYMLSTTPSSSTIGTALMPRSEKMCTTSNTLVFMVAVASGKKRSKSSGSLWNPLERALAVDTLLVRDLLAGPGEAVACME